MVRTFALGSSCSRDIWRRPGRNLQILTACCFWRCALRRIRSRFAQLYATRSRPNKTHGVLKNISGVSTGKGQNIGSPGYGLFVICKRLLCSGVVLAISGGVHDLVVFAIEESCDACDSLFSSRLRFQKDRGVGTCVEGHWENGHLWMFFLLRKRNAWLAAPDLPLRLRSCFSLLSQLDIF